MNKKFKFLLIFLWGVSLTGISVLSGYDIRRSVGDINLEIAMMLTPSSLVRNLILFPDNYLYPYYFQETASRALMFENISLTLVFFAVLIFAFGLLKMLRADLK